MGLDVGVLSCLQVVGDTSPLFCLSGGAVCGTANEKYRSRNSLAFCSQWSWHFVDSYPVARKMTPSTRIEQTSPMKGEFVGVWHKIYTARVPMANEQKTGVLTLFLMALGAVLFHIALNRQYGIYRDELDFILNARHLDWGYVSYPPITPLFAHIGLELFGESLRWLRILHAIGQAIVMILAALIAHDMVGYQ
jgi:hypothetical protein